MFLWASKRYVQLNYSMRPELMCTGPILKIASELDGLKTAHPERKVR